MFSLWIRKAQGCGKGSDAMTKKIEGFYLASKGIF